MEYFINYRKRELAFKTGSDELEENTSIIFDDRFVPPHAQKALLEEINEEYDIRGKKMSTESLTNSDLMSFLSKKGYLLSIFPEIEEKVPNLYEEEGAIQ